MDIRSIQFRKRLDNLDLKEHPDERSLAFEVAGTILTQTNKIQYVCSKYSSIQVILAD